MKTFFVSTLLVVLLCFAGQRHTQADETAPGAWKQALPGWQYHFPEDNLIHPEFKTEWWYFTGHLCTGDGHRYGYELTFFRQGMLAPGKLPEGAQADGKALSRFVQNDFKFAHFAISDLTEKEFHYTEQISRGAFGEAGFGQGQDRRIAWLEDWQLDEQPDGAWRLRAKAKTPVPMQIDLTVNRKKPAAIEGTDGVSQKAAGLGNASHYYSFTCMDTSGMLALGERSQGEAVKGETWFDHEWASNQLASDQVGWDWFCVQFDDHTELMLYAMRRRDGSIDPASAGTYIDAQGNTEHLARADFQMHSTRSWHSAKTGADYPLAWEVSIPSRKMNFTITAEMDQQELALPLISYWEGATNITGQREGRKLGGLGYMELTGYAGELQGLKSKAGSGVGNIPR